MCLQRKNKTLKFHFIRGSGSPLDHCLPLNNSFPPILKRVGVHWSPLPICEWLTANFELAANYECLASAFRLQNIRT